MKLRKYFNYIHNNFHSQLRSHENVTTPIRYCFIRKYSFIGFGVKQAYMFTLKRINYFPVACFRRR